MKFKKKIKIKGQKPEKTKKKLILKKEINSMRMIYFGNISGAHIIARKLSLWVFFSKYKNYYYTIY